MSLCTAKNYCSESEYSLCSFHVYLLSSPTSFRGMYIPKTVVVLFKKNIEEMTYV